MYIDVFTDIVNEYNIKYQGTIKMKPDSLKSSPTNGFRGENHVIISK